MRLPFFARQLGVFGPLLLVPLDKNPPLLHSNFSRHLIRLGLMPHDDSQSEGRRGRAMRTESSIEKQRWFDTVAKGSSGTFK
jgi:hypothetical protein